MMIFASQFSYSLKKLMMILFGLCIQTKQPCFPNVCQGISAALQSFFIIVLCIIVLCIINAHLHIVQYHLIKHLQLLGFGYDTWPYCEFDISINSSAFRVVCSSMMCHFAKFREFKSSVGSVLNMEAHESWVLLHLGPWRL